MEVAQLVKKLEPLKCTFMCIKKNTLIAEHYGVELCMLAGETELDKNPDYQRVILDFLKDYSLIEDIGYVPSDETIPGYKGLNPAALGQTGLTFEIINRNLASVDIISATSNTMTYANGIIKTITEPDENTIIVTLSGDVPDGIDLIKTIVSDGSDCPTVTYST